MPGYTVVMWWWGVRYDLDTGVAGHLTQSLAYRFPVQVLLQILYHFRRVWYTSKYNS